jgi:nucleotidyltransferase substrate binding protein (TIGR01987 family)
MEKYSRAFERFKKSFKKFKEVIDNPVIPEIFKEEFLIEITTKRFEYTYESLWKTIKEFLRIRGIECNSPKSCFREFIKEGIISEDFERILAEMIVLRNILVHVYDEKQAKEIYERVKQKDIIEVFQKIITSLEKEKP